MLNNTFGSLSAQPYFEGLEYELAVALENFNNKEMDKAFDVERQLHLIKTRGMCKEYYVALESISEGILTGIDYRRLTTHPSKTYQTIAIETAEKSGFFSKFSNSGGIANFFITFFDWLVGKLTGHGSLGLAGRLQEAWVKGRRKADKLHDYEATITDAMIKYKSDQVFTRLIKHVADSIDNGDDRNAAEIASALIEACSRDQGHSVVPNIALAKTCIANNCSVADFRVVSERMSKFSLLKSNPAQTCGLAATRQGLPSAILIGSEINLDARLGADIEALGKQYVHMARAMAKMPMQATGVDGWLHDIEKQSDIFTKKVAASGSVKRLVDRWNSDGGFADKLNDLQNGTIGFWYDTEAQVQGDIVFNPDKYGKVVRSVFEMNREGAMDVFSRSVENTIVELQGAVQTIRNVDQQRMEKLVGAYNSNSARLREVIKSFRSDATTLLRIARIMESYVNGYVRAFKSVKPFRSTYEAAAQRITSAPISL